MLNDFDLISRNFKSGVTIYPVGDVHLGALEHNEGAWKDFLKRVNAEDAYIVLVGDLLNNGVRGCKFANPFDEVLRPREAKARMVQYLEPLRERIIAAVGGNHERRTERETDIDLTRDIMCKLDLEHLYRQNLAFVLLGCGERKSENKACCKYTLCITHGAGGGIYTGAALNRSERFGNIDGLDCLITAHVHKGFVSRPAKICVDAHNCTVSVKHYTVVSCVSWLEYGGYAARAMLSPAATCNPQKLVFSADKHNKEIRVIW